MTISVPSVRFGLVCLLAVLCALPVPGATQEADLQCAELVTNAFTYTGSACANLGPNSACMGYDSVTFNLFDQRLSLEPRPELTDVCSVAIGQADIVTDTYGIALVHGQSNIPDSLETSVSLVQIGGVGLVNNVQPEEAFAPGAGIAVSTVAEAEYRVATSSPPAISEVLGTIPAGTPLVVDVLSDGGDWARTVFDARPVWVPVTALDTARSLGTLPRYGEDNLTPMQAFSLDAPTQANQCSRSIPTLMLVNSPLRFPVDFVVHCVPMRFQGLSVFRLQDDRLALTVLDGLVTLNPDTPDELTLPPGFKVRADYSAAERVCGECSSIGPWSDPEPVTREELVSLALIEEFSVNILVQPVELPTIIQPSGVGGVHPVIQLASPESSDLVESACLDGQIQADLCESFAIRRPAG